MSSITGNDDNDQQFVGGSGDMISSKKECTSCEQNNIDNITEGIKVWWQYWMIHLYALIVARRVKVMI